MAIVLSLPRQGWILPRGLAAGTPGLESGPASPEPEGPLSLCPTARLTVPLRALDTHRCRGQVSSSHLPPCPSAL